ncbi:MAG TPA: FMN-binding protein [Firmicutes bacterium]|jgi:RnfABCDGE-type electron transport complex G subunit|nr:FMN-binding protein [Bacillota bacterium]
MKQVAKLGLTLALICAVAGLGLAAVYAKTKPIIDKRAEEDLLNAAREVISGASAVEEQALDGTRYWIGKKGSQVVGAAVQVEAQGYGSESIQMMVGVGTDGKITDVQIVSMSETPGIGTRVKDEAFLARFRGIDNPAGVDGISGATVSSGAVKAGVSKALAFLSAAIAPSAGDGELAIDFAQLPDGTYEGSGTGLFGPIKVAVTAKAGKVTEIKVLEHRETAGIADPAFSRVPESMIEKQTVDVDTITGATFTSEGIIDAVKDALKPFGVRQGAGDVPKDITEIADGEYGGTGNGLFGPIKVSVTMEGGKIVDIKVLEHRETAGISDPAFKYVPQDIIDKQSLDVDTVAGATFASEGVIEAVKNALQGSK